MILLTKLQIPTLPAGYQPRKKLTKKIDYWLTKGNLLISAPAGYGKTTLIVEWATQHNQPIGWLSLDPSDNHLRQLVTALIATLRTRLPTIGRTTNTILQSQQPLSLNTLLTPLLNEIAIIPDTITLIIDDCHYLTEPQTIQLISILVEQQPDNLRLIMLARHQLPLPTARWQTAGKLFQLNTTDLQLSLPEIQRFWQAQTGGNFVYRAVVPTCSSNGRVAGRITTIGIG